MDQNSKDDIHYIAYLDFVGTKNSALINEDLYNKSIKTILRELKKLSKKYPNVKLTMLSDSIFLTSPEKQIFSYLRELRVNLFTYSIYFPCAIQKGTLGLSSRAEDTSTPANLEYFTFGHSDTVRVFAQQAKLKGLAIDVTSLTEFLTEDEYVTSYYFSDDNLYEFKDLSYTNPNGTNDKMILDNFECYLNSIFRESNIQSMTNSNATKYYLTPFISLLQCALRNNPHISEDIFSIAFKLFNKPILKENHNILCMYAYLVNLRLKANDSDESDTQFIRENKDNFYFKTLIRNLSQIPSQLLSLKYKKKISEIIYGIS